MSGVLKAVGAVAGIVALVPSPIQPIAAAVAIAANVGAALTARKPAAITSGSVNKTTIGANQPRPYLIGETYYGGNRRHWTGYGGKVGGVENPYLLMVDVYSGAGPVEGLVARYLDYVELPMAGNAATGYAANHLYSYHQLGQTPEAQALPVHWTTAPGWGPDYRLSSYAAISWCLRFDEDGKRFSAGIPATGAVWRGVKTYDPRKDSTYPGGSGPHRWADPADKAAFAAAKATWEWTRCPGLHGLRYALGSWDRDETKLDDPYLKTFGIGIPIDGIRVADFVALANVCDANGWHVDGVITEPGNRDENLKNILAAGGAERCWVGGRLALKLSAPRVALDTITEDDLASDEVEVGAMQGWEERINTLTPKYRSAAHKWEYVPSTPVQIATFLAEDGEEKGEERQWNLVQDKDQVAQLAAYDLLDARELGEIVLTCKPRLRRYGAGDLVIVHLPDDGLVQQPCVILRRTFDPASMRVELILRGETPGKHDFALGRTGTAPPTPTLVSTEAIDAAVPDVLGQIQAIEAALNSIVADGILSRSEKRRAIVEYQALHADLDALLLRYAQAGATAAIDAARATATAQVGQLNGYLQALAPAWDDIEQDTPIVGETYRQHWIGAHRAVSDFRSALMLTAGQGGVATDNLVKGSVTTARAYFGSDTSVGTFETTLVESDIFSVGDDEYGQATAQISFVQDCSRVKDAGWMVRIYVGTADGYGAPIYQEPQGLRTSGQGDTLWAFPCTIPLSLSATQPVRIKVTAQSIAFAGGDAKLGSRAGKPSITIFNGAR